MKQLIISVGRKHDPQLAAAIDDFTTRLSREIETEWRFVKPSGADEVTARRLESVSVLDGLRSGDVVVLCDERGLELTSEDFAARYDGWVSNAERLVFIIGGAYGVDDALQRRADYVWSLSKLVFPHQLVRLILVEQLYRARMITKNHPYHHA